MDYTKPQLSAIRSIDQNLQIIACAGSGKTQVISHRVVYTLRRLRAEGVTPGNVVAFTFTEKAAAELKNRIYQLYVDEFGCTQGLAEMFVGTIHAYCLNLLQSPPLYKFLKYSVLNDVQQRLLIDRYSNVSGLSQVPLLDGGYLRRWVDSRLYQQVLAILEEGDIQRNRVPSEMSTAIRKYRELLDRKKLLDYTSIMSEALSSLKSERRLRRAIAANVKFLIVDEYQDVNPLQERLIWELHTLGANVCVVGDDDQTIYQWRGSDVSNILNFADRYRGVKSVTIDDNFRSSSGIVFAAGRVIEKNNPKRLHKRMRASGFQELESGDMLALAFRDPDAEAKWIAEKIQELYGTSYQDNAEAKPRGLSYSDFAALYRSVRADAGPLMQALDRAKIRYSVIGTNGLFDCTEIQALRAVFYFLAGVPIDGKLTRASDVEAALAHSGLGLTRAQIARGLRFLQAVKKRSGKFIEAELFLQRVYLDFLKSLQLREEAINKSATDGGTGEIAYYNLGKFSEVISDFEHINLDLKPADLYGEFARFLHYRAPDYYPETWKESSHDTPDAVQVMTVHQAKGMQWPAVFVPCLRDNRFPSSVHGGRTPWHILPKESVRNWHRYKGSIEDERRLFYVALTRAEKYLFCTWAPNPDKRNQRNVSPFFTQFRGALEVAGPKTARRLRHRLPPLKRRTDDALALTFSKLKYYFECPYLFKLRCLYGFNEAIDRAIGYGKSLHDALAEIHAESLAGNVPREGNVPRLVAEHLHLPFANPTVRTYLQTTAERTLRLYLRQHRHRLTKLQHVEKPIELKLADGIVVSGRIDLIRHTETGEIAVVDFKSDERVQAEQLSRMQLHTYAVGYEQLTGKKADFIEVHSLDNGRVRSELVDGLLVQKTIKAIESAGRELRRNHLPRNKAKAKCRTCRMRGICH